jgi:uncharacterized protein with GYD domain
VKEESMGTYIMLTNLTDEGAKTLSGTPDRLKTVNREIEQLGAKVISQWATLGRYDFVNVVEAPDEETVARLSIALSSRGSVRIETLTAIPIDRFIGRLTTKK